MEAPSPTATSAASVVVLTAPRATPDAAAKKPFGARTRGGLLSAGSAHACAVLATGAVKCWGSGSVGPLGLGDKEGGGAPRIELDALPAVDLGTGRTAVAVAAGAMHTCALLDTGAVKCWGEVGFGQLGLGDTKCRRDAKEMGDALPAVDLGTGRTAVAVTAGLQHTCALLNGGAIKCWGFGAFGQLGLGAMKNRGDRPNEMGDALPAVDLGTGRTAVAVSAGAFHTCAVLDTGAVKCWGHFSRLGLGDKNDRGSRPNEMGDALPAVDLGVRGRVVAVSAGAVHTCALLDGGAVKCWGEGDDGQLGLGDGKSRGSAPNEMGDALPAVDLGTGRGAVAVSAGRFHTCAVLDNGAVKCWGRGAEGQLGLGDKERRGVGPDEMGDLLPAVDLGTGRTAVAVSAGSVHTCALLDTGAVKCWGAGLYLGLGGVNARGDDPKEMGDALPAVDLGGGGEP